MDIDFSLVLVCLVSGCAALWLLDTLWFKKFRLQAIADYEGTQAKGKTEEKVAQDIAGLSQEPLIIEYAKSFLSMGRLRNAMGFVSQILVAL